jgi:hypothetical protein
MGFIFIVKPIFSIGTKIKLILLNPKINSTTKAHSFVSKEEDNGNGLSKRPIIRNVSSKARNETSHKHHTNHTNYGKKVIHNISF